MRMRFRRGMLNGTMLARARRMRHNAGDAETKLWSRLRRKELGVTFRRQYPIAGFIADFCCLESKLIVELDGSQHVEAVAYDTRRTTVLAGKGFRVLRFWNTDVTENIEGVLEQILEAVEAAPSPLPSPMTKKMGEGKGKTGTRSHSSSPAFFPRAAMAIIGRWSLNLRMASESAISARGAPPAPRRILIVLLGSIGDVVRALPLLGRLRRAWPQAHIAWAVEPKSEPILRHHPWLDEIIVHDRSRAPWQFIPFLRRIRAGNFDLVLDLQRHLKSGLTSFSSRAKDRIGFAPINAKEGNHRFSTRWIEPQPAMKLKLLQYQAFADALGIPRSPIDFGLALPENERADALRLIASAPPPRLGVILGSSWPSRVYFPEMTAAVIRELAHATNGERPLFPILLGGPSEGPLAAQVMRNLDAASALNLAGRTTLRDLVAIFDECAVAFGPDSGPMHIAAAVGCPVVSLWGATAPERSAPWGFAEFALRGEIPCSPCYLRRCPIGRECMRRIAPEAVAAAVRQALAAAQRSFRSASPAPASEIRH